MHTYNEEQVIEKTVEDFLKQDNVEKVIVIDNHSTDKTIEYAQKAGATVITKTSNKGYAHSWYTGLTEALKTDANIIVITDGDGTYNGYDISKMSTYLENCDMVVGSRMVQVLCEKTNQNDTFLDPTTISQFSKYVDIFEISYPLYVPSPSVITIIFASVFKASVNPVYQE
jgi:glycosyltransferase involved in cell wall biosynthesis